MSDLDNAIAAARRDIASEESPVRRALRNAYDRSVDELTVNLEQITRQIRDARAAGETINPDWLRRQTRYRTLIAQAEREFARFTDEGLRILRDGQVRAVSGGAAEAWELAEAAGITTGFRSNINRPAVERLSAALGSDSPVRRVLDSYGTRASQVIEERLVQGVIQGTGPREIVRQIRRELTSGSTRARLDTLVIDQMNKAFEGSLFDQYATMGLEQWRWAADKGIRTCLACLAMDGRVFSMKQPFMRRHIRCRCIPTPYVQEVPYEIGPDWFARQPAATQRVMMPSGAAYDAFARGDVQLKDFVGQKRSKVWGTSIFERSGRDVLGRVAS